MYKGKTLIVIVIVIALVVVVLNTTGCSPEPSRNDPSKEEQESGLGEIGHLNVSRHVDTSHTYGLKVEASGVLGATRYYLYCSKTDDPSTATIIVDNGTNSLSTSLDRFTTSGTYYFWYRAGNGTDYTDYSNRVSLSF